MPRALARGRGLARLPDGRLPGDLDRVYGYPVELAAAVAIAAVREQTAPPIEIVRFVLFSDAALEVFRAALTQR